jgi:hypothetical protein
VAGTYAYLPYRDYFAWNFIDNSALANTIEVPGGLMEMNLKLTEEESLFGASKYPPLRFKGTSRMDDGRENVVRGGVYVRSDDLSSL